MIPSEGSAPFDDPAYLFEPWWPGTRVLAVVAGGTLRLEAAELADVLGTFPELGALPGQLAVPDAIVEGTVLVLDRGARPDADLLRRRLADPSVRAGRPAFIATDLLAAGGRRLTRRPFSRRRERLQAILATTDWCTTSRGYPGEGRTLAVAAAQLGFRALSARRLDAPYRAGPAGGAWLRVPLGPDLPHDERRLPPIIAVFRRLPLDLEE